MIVHNYTEYGDIEITINSTFMIVPDDMRNIDRQTIAEWEALGNTIPPYIPPVIDLSALDQTVLNQALTQDGSVVRALALLFLQEINVLRKRATLPEYTPAQLITALKAKMR